MLHAIVQTTSRYCYCNSTVVQGAEIALRNNQMCNLTEIKVSDVETQDEFNDRCYAASFIGTLQAGYTDFHYLRSVWQETCEEDALLGVSMTGIASEKFLSLNLTEGAEIAKNTNIWLSEMIKINPSARITTVKPAGTTSLVLGSSSGIHAWHDDYYIRRVRVGKDEAIYSYLSIHNPELLEDEFFNPTKQAVISIPQKAPEGAITRQEGAKALLERIKKVYSEWVLEGHVYGNNTHNVSATVSVKEDEWDYVRDWMWENRYYYNGISILPYDGGTYMQAPFETITEEKYLELFSNLHSLNLEGVIEVSDNTALTDQAACAGNNCEI